MDTKTFNENYELDRKAKSVRANPKTVAALPVPQIKTADGEIFSPDKIYFFFDEATRGIRPTNGLRQIEVHYLGSFGLRVVEIAKLRKERDGALADAQDFFREQIAELNKLIAETELQKSPQNRSLKDYLMAKDEAVK